MKFTPDIYLQLEAHPYSDIMSSSRQVQKASEHSIRAEFPNLLQVILDVQCLIHTVPLFFCKYLCIVFL